MIEILELQKILTQIEKIDNKLTSKNVKCEEIIEYYPVYNELVMKATSMLEDIDNLFKGELDSTLPELSTMNILKYMSILEESKNSNDFMDIAIKINSIKKALTTKETPISLNIQFENTDF
jgi:hypothetical protein